jgi:hypothetical protein
MAAFTFWRRRTVKCETEDAKVKQQGRQSGFSLTQTFKNVQSGSNNGIPNSALESNNGITISNSQLAALDFGGAIRLVHTLSLNLTSEPTSSSIFSDTGEYSLADECAVCRA